MKDLSVFNAKQTDQLKENTFCFEQLICQCVHKIMSTFALFWKNTQESSQSDSIASTFASLPWQTCSGMSSTKPSPWTLWIEYSMHTSHGYILSETYFCWYVSDSIDIGISTDKALNEHLHSSFSLADCHQSFKSSTIGCTQVCCGEICANYFVLKVP